MSAIRCSTKVENTPACSVKDPRRTEEILPHNQNSTFTTYLHALKNTAKSIK